MAKSLAFWLEGGKPNVADIELHFNYWSLNSSSSKGNLDYLDIGVKFSGLREVTSINIFFPFKIDASKYVSSLGRAVCQSDTLIAAIFNTNIREKKPNGERTDISFMGEHESTLRFHCQIEQGAPGDGVGMNSHGEAGTTISFPMGLFRTNNSDAEEVGLKNYFRFRIKMSGDDKKMLSQVYKSKDSKLLSRLESTEIVDFRVNEIRNLPPQIRSKLEIGGCIKCVHFFLIRETDSEHKLSHTKFKRCRVLEKDLWDAYLRVGNIQGLNIPDQMLIYHWKESKEESKPNENAYIEDFSAFAKFSKTVVTGSTIFYFASTVIFLGLMSGFFSGLGASYTYSWLTASAKPNPSSEVICNGEPTTDEVKGN